MADPTTCEACAPAVPGEDADPCYSCRPESWAEEIQALRAGPGPALSRVQGAIEALEMEAEATEGPYRLSEELTLLRGVARVLEGEVDRG